MDTFSLSANPLDVIRTSNYLGVSMLLSDKSFAVTKAYLLEAIKLKDAGILRLLLINDAADPNAVIVDAIEGSTDEMIVALLEHKKMRSSLDMDPTMLACCKLNRYSVIEVLLKKLSFDPGIRSHIYLIEAIEHESVQALGAMCGDMRFDVKWNDLQLLAMVAGKGNSYMVDILLKHPHLQDAKIGSDILAHAVNSGDTDTFKALYQSRQCIGIKPSVIETCFPANRNDMFLTVITRMKPTFITKIFHHCIRASATDRMDDIINVTKLVPTLNDMMRCVRGNYLSSADTLFKHMVPICEGADCCVMLAIDISHDAMAAKLITHMMNAGTSCYHTNEFFERAVKAKCSITAQKLLTGTLHIDDYMTGLILDHGSIELVTKLAASGRQIPETLIASCIVKENIAVVRIVCSHIRPDFSWNNYQLYRLASVDHTSITFNALYGK